jgi:hypothetical protein
MYTKHRNMYNIKWNTDLPQKMTIALDYVAFTVGDNMNSGRATEIQEK